MTRMFFDTEETVVRTRIRKFRDTGSHHKYRLLEATVLVDLVERMLNASVADYEEQPAPDENPQEEKVEDEGDINLSG